MDLGQLSKPNAIPLLPFAFSQLILIEALTHLWLVGVLGVIFKYNISSTNIGAAVLLTKIVCAKDLSPGTNRVAAVSPWLVILAR
ncbi:hypothetical protein DXG03_000498 [Asterophora parasitica]|uniref:Uncharacterized protein n=1 Tax=Asterophora parasitica TaxID=117018 RepID=A0A9P7G3Z8_9AGAR|nr:hypothetical protein DXG03_000498 [Asterophora parasitica]